jgi:hypothetical protein
MEISRKLSLSIDTYWHWFDVLVAMDLMISIRGTQDSNLSTCRYHATLPRQKAKIIHG